LKLEDARKASRVNVTEFFGNLKAGLQIRIRIILGSWIRIRIKVEIQELQRFNKDPWWAADTDKRGARAQNGILEGGSLDQRWRMNVTLMRSRIRIRLRIEVKSRIRNRIEVKRWIRIRIPVMRIRNHA
jgi:hypothetical protein